MKSYKKFLIFAILFIGVAITFSLNVNTAAASQSNIYVSPIGHDTWNGQSPIWNGRDGPKRTIKSGVRTVRSGGTVNIAHGTYKENNIVISKSMKIKGESKKNTIVNGRYLGNIFTVKSGLTVSISNLRFDSGKNRTGGALHNSGKTTLTSTSFTNNKATSVGGAIYNRAVLNINSSTFTRNTAVTGGGSIFNHAYLAVNKSTFISNHVSGGGGAIRTSKGTTKINGCTFQGNNVIGGGGAVFNENGRSSNPNTSTMTINYSRFIANRARDGGALDNNYGKMTVYKCTFSNNTAASKGGAIVNYHGSLTMSNCNGDHNQAINLGGILFTDRSVQISNSNFTSNRVLRGSGGVIYNYHAYINITGCNFNYNTATGSAPNGYGGAIHTYLGKIRLTSCSFTGNTATTGGGAIVNDEGSSLIINYSKFINNKAIGNAPGRYGNGGAIFTYNANLWAYKTNFIGNRANTGNRGGGAIDALSTEYVTHNIAQVKNCYFKDNIASKGGAIDNTCGTFTVTNSTFIGNKAYRDGGALYTVYGNLLVQYNYIQNNSAVNNGAALFNTGYNIKVHYNNIIGNTGANVIYSPSNGTVYAQYNWWGQDTDPSGMVYRPDMVIVNPWLHSPQPL